MVNIWDFPYKNLKYITNNTNKLHSGQMPAQSQQKRQKKNKTTSAALVSLLLTLNWHFLLNQIQYEMRK